MANAKDKDDEIPVDGVAEGADNPDEDDAAKGQDDMKARGFGKNRADKTKQEDVAEDQDFGKKGKGSKK